MVKNRNVWLNNAWRNCKNVVGGILVACVLVTVLMYVLFLLIDAAYSEYVTTDINEYGRYIGNNNNQIPTEFISGFFPTEIDPKFVQPTYYYRAQAGDTYACEAYLEYSISNREYFDEEYDLLLLKYGQPETFTYDNRYVIWTISDILCLSPSVLSSSNNIDQAEVGLVLCDVKTGQFCYYALMVYDGGGADTDTFNYFFNKFGISPTEYNKVP